MSNFNENSPDDVAITLIATSRIECLLFIRLVCIFYQF